MSLLENKLNGSNLSNTTEPKNLEAIQAITGNLYKSIYVAIERANQINTQLKQEISDKLEEFDSHIESASLIDIEQDNKEQVELSKMYERIANPVLQAVDELLNHKLFIKEKIDVESKEI